MATPDPSLVTDKMGKEKRSYDSKQPENWTVAKLKGKLREKGVSVLSSYKKAQLVSLWKQNEAKNYVNEADPVTSQGPRMCANNNSQHDSSIASALLELSSTMKCAMDSVQQSVGILSQKVATLEQRTVPIQNPTIILQQSVPMLLAIHSRAAALLTSVGLTLLPVHATQYCNHRRSGLLGT